MSAPWHQDLAHQPRIANFLGRLAVDPPRALLLEGGTVEERLHLALFWAARLHCPEPSPPCGVCRSCRQIADNACRDLILLDGAEGVITVETVRELRSQLGDTPAGHGFRVVVLAEAQALGDSAANALLKSLEEPRPGNLFVLLVPNREILLPTLVSRSFVLTLRWPHGGQEDVEIREWMSALAEFVQTGKGSWLEWTSKKGQVDAALAGRILRDVQRGLLQAAHGAPLTALARVFAGRLDVVAARQVGVVVENALESLDVHANPALVVEWMAMRVWGIMRS